MPSQHRLVANPSLRRWAAAVIDAWEPCLLLDASSAIVAASVAGAEMIGLDDRAGARGQRLREVGLLLVDFTDPPDPLACTDADKIPPLLALSSGRLARALMRVACPQTQRSCTMDAVATPLWDADQVVGSLTFFSKV